MTTRMRRVLALAALAPCVVGASAFPASADIIDTLPKKDDLGPAAIIHKQQMRDAIRAARHPHKGEAATCATSSDSASRAWE